MPAAAASSLSPSRTFQLMLPTPVRHVALAAAVHVPAKTQQVTARRTSRCGKPACHAASRGRCQRRAAAVPRRFTPPAAAAPSSG